MNFKEFLPIFRQLSNRHDGHIDENTRIEEDLGITGDEADDLIVDMKNHFNIDTSGFSFRKYFHDEFSLNRFHNGIKVQFTVGDLYRACRDKVLV